LLYYLNYKNNGFFLTHKGLITIDEIHEANGLIHGHEEFDSHKYQIINLLDADFSTINQSESIEPAATDLVASKIQPNVKVALVVREANAINFCKLYISESKRHASPWDIKIFSDLEGALEWSCT
jgi:hypothetical protein